MALLSCRSSLPPHKFGRARSQTSLPIRRAASQDRSGIYRQVPTEPQISSRRLFKIIVICHNEITQAVSLDFCTNKVKHKGM